MERFNFEGLKMTKCAKMSSCVPTQPWLDVYNPHFTAQRDTSVSAASRKIMHAMWHTHQRLFKRSLETALIACVMTNSDTGRLLLAFLIIFFYIYVLLSRLEAEEGENDNTHSWVANNDVTSSSHFIVYRCSLFFQSLLRLLVSTESWVTTAAPVRREFVER